MAEGVDFFKGSILLVKEASHSVSNTAWRFARHDHLVVVLGRTFLQGDHDGASGHGDDTHFTTTLNVQLLVTIAFVGDAGFDEHSVFNHAFGLAVLASGHQD